MDMYMKCVPCSDCEIPSDRLSAHRIILQTLRLVVDLTVDRIDMEKLERDNSSSISKNMRTTIWNGVDGSQQAIKAVQRVLNTITETACSVLDHLGEAIHVEKHVMFLAFSLHNSDLINFLRWTLT